MQRKHIAAVLAAGLSLFSGAGNAITVQFDYSFDDGFFTSDKRAVMDEVASLFGTNLTDSLAAITSGGFNSATFRPFNPINPAATLSLANASIAADTVRIYLGSAELGGNTLGLGGPGGYSGGGNQSFITALTTRGQTGAALANPTDFGSWGGSVSFDKTSNWYVDSNVATTESFMGYDFYSVAMHEVGHVLGLGTADSWDTYISGAGFTGANATSVFGSVVPLSSGHWATGTQSFVNGLLQDTAMSPSIGFGQRKYFTQLDWAGMRDVGWQVASLDASPMAAVPEPSEYAMLLAGLGLIAWAARRQRQG